LSTIKHDTYALATPAGRKPGTRGHRRAARYIEHRFAGLGLEPYGDRYRLPYTAIKWPDPVRDRKGTVLRRGRPVRLPMTNLVGVVPGRDRSLPPVLIGAHYDSVLKGACADDNATSVAAMLSAAGRIAAAPLERDVVIAAFDGEEPPFFLSAGMGSTRFVEDELRGEVHLAIIMDLIGHPAPIAGVDPHLTAVTGIESHPALAGVLDGGTLPVIAARNSLVGDMSDHHAFRLNGMPFLFLSSGEWPDYHTRADTPDKIDYGKVAAVAGEIERMARYADPAGLGPAVRHDIAALELSTAVAHLGEGLVDALGGDPATIVPALRGAMRGRPARV
jgi:hypothetical protein